MTTITEFLSHGIKKKEKKKIEFILQVTTIQRGVLRMSRRRRCSSAGGRCCTKSNGPITGNVFCHLRVKNLLLSLC